VSRAPHADPTFPAALGASLDEAFASEVAVRLPRLLGAANRLTDGIPEAAGEILSDTHALASSAAVVGEDVAAYAARECEQLMAAYLHAAHHRDVPAQPTGQAGLIAPVIRITGAVDALRLALSRWVDPSMAPTYAAPPLAGRA
jgi:hypothetical protein